MTAVHSHTHTATTKATQKARCHALRPLNEQAAIVRSSTSFKDGPHSYIQKACQPPQDSSPLSARLPGQLHLAHLIFLFVSDDLAFPLIRFHCNLQSSGGESLQALVLFRFFQGLKRITNLLYVMVTLWLLPGYYILHI